MEAPNSIEQPPCERCDDGRVLGSSSCGWHRTTHIVVGDFECCVDVGIADAVVKVRQAGLITVNSCEAWQWWPDPQARPNFVRIDFSSGAEAIAAAGLLGLSEYLTEPVSSRSTLLWLPDTTNR